MCFGLDFTEIYSQPLISKGPFDDKSGFVQVMAWCWIGSKPYLNLFDPDLCHYQDMDMGSPV